MSEIKILGIKISNPDKKIYVSDNITKLDVIKYYEDMSVYILKEIKDRPLSVIRCHQGVNDECFFKKHPTTERSHVNIFNIDKDEYFYINSKKQLIYQAQNGTIEFHIWGCKYNLLDSPNLMVFDLDPDEKLPLKKLRLGVEYLKLLLDELGLKSILKTSGGKGYHIMVNFNKKLSWDLFGDFAKNVAVLLESKYPKLFTTNIRKDCRGGKIFIDYLRNKFGSTCVAPYSLRARPHAPISMPIAWEDLYKIRPNEITIKNYKKYLKK